MKTSLCHAADAFKSIDAGMSGVFQTFARVVENRSVGEMGELFTQTFDLDPACALEIGWHLFGESYDRGLFLTWMRQQLREYGIPEQSDLPDHLAHVMRVLARLDDERARSFSRLLVLPAVERIASGLTDEANPYTTVYEAMRELLTAWYGPAEGESSVSLPVLQDHENLFALEGA